MFSSLLSKIFSLAILIAHFSGIEVAGYVFDQHPLSILHKDRLIAYYPLDQNFDNSVVTQSDSRYVLLYVAKTIYNSDYLIF